MTNEIGAEFVVNNQRDGDAFYQDVATLSDGRFVVVWRSSDDGDGSGSNIRGRLFSGDGSPLGDDFIINSSTLYSQEYPAVTALRDGGFAVAWSSSDGGDNSGFGIRARFFDNEGVPISDDFIANSDFAGDQSFPDIIQLSTGDVLLAWANNSGDGASAEGRLFDTAGQALGTEVELLSSSRYLPHPKLAALDNGGFAVSDYSGNVALYDGAASQLHTLRLSGPSLREVTLGTLADGRLIATWGINDAIDGQDFRVVGRLINTDGTFAGDEFQLNSTGVGSQIRPEIVALDNGGFVAVWLSSDEDDQSGHIVRARAFDENAEPLGLDYITNINRSVGHLSAELLNDGRLAITWLTREETIDGLADIRATIIDPIPTGATVGGTAVHEKAYGTAFDDLITPGGGNDIIHPGRGNDIIDGGEGDDAIKLEGRALAWEADRNPGENAWTLTSREGHGTKTISDVETIDVGGWQGSPADFAELPRAGGEDFIVNHQSYGNQERPVTASLTNGRTIVVWQTPETNTHDNRWDVRARLIEPDGSFYGNDIEISAKNQGDYDRFPAVTALQDGGFAIVWATSHEISYRKFDADGLPQGGEFVIDSFTSSGGSATELSIAQLASGNIVIAWQSRTASGDGDNGIEAKILDADGTTVADSFSVNVVTRGTQNSPSIQPTTNGGFVLFWSSDDDTDGSSYAIKARSFDGNGQPLTDEFLINTTGTGRQYEPSSVLLDDGRIFVVWESSDNADGVSYAIRGRFLASDGSPLGGDFIVNSATNASEFSPDVVRLPDGRILVVWSSGISNAYEIKGRLLESDGTPVGNEFLINTTTSGNQSEPTITVFSDGRVFVGWQTTDTGDGSGYGIRGTFLDTSASAESVVLSNATVAEGAGFGTEIGQLAATGFTPTGTVTFSLLDDAGGRFRIDGDRLVVANGDLIDFEAAPFYSVTVRMADQAGRVFEDRVSIEVLDRNEAPTNVALSPSSIVENAAGGTLVGSLSGSDPENAGAVTFQLLSDADGLFRLAGNEILVADGAALDFETDSSHTIGVRATDATGQFADRFITINVTNSAEAPTDIALSSNSVAENSAGGTLVGILSATDPNDTTGFTFTVIGGAGAKFEVVNGDELRVVDGAALDHEAGPETVTLQVADGEGNSYSESLSIAVTNLNEAPTGISLSSATVAENSAPGTVVGTLATVDVDPGDSHVYSITSDPSGFFQNIGNEIRVRDAANLDYETATSHQITVETRDAGGLTTSQIFTITVTDVPEDGSGAGSGPTGIQLSPNNVLENVAPGTLIGVLSATDPDDTSGFTFEIVGGASDKFLITNGNELRVAAGAVFDHEATLAESLVVRVADSGGNVLNEELSISVVDVNEAPTAITLTGTTVPENSAGGTAIGTFSSADPDVADSHTYTVLNDPSGFFTIVGDVLQVLPQANLDYESATSHSITVESRDAGGLSATRDFTISVSDIAEGNDGNSSDPIIGTEGDDDILGGAGEDIIDGGSGDDDLDGGGGADSIQGGPGNDTINGGGGEDEVFGGPGTDDINGNDGDDILSGGDGNDTISGGQGDDLIWGQDGSDQLDGGDGDDLVDGGSGDDILIGGPGDDRLYGRSGNDLIIGNEGNDLLDGGAGSDILRGGAGDDTYYVDDVTDIVEELPNSGNDTVISTISIALPENVENGVLSGADPLSLTGTESANSLEGNNAGNLILGGDGFDFISGKAGGDQLFGEEGNDTILGGRGRDKVFGGSGNDILNGGSGRDVLRGEDGNDKIYGSKGKDRLFGDEGNDRLYGNDGSDYINGGDGRDIAYFEGRAARYEIKKTGNDRAIVIDTSDGDRNVVVDVEVLRFSDDDVGL